VLKNGALLRVVNASNGDVLAERTEVAASPWRRMRGLLGRPPLSPGQGLLIRPCQGVHTLGMAYPIDVVHLDKDFVVRKVLHGLKPWRVGPIVWRSSTVLELPAGVADTTSQGDRLALAPAGPPSEATSA
jgi:uncharacterized membrane protein (UPF0127 family)